MTSAEKVQNCMDLKPIKDRRDIPVYPMLISYPGKFAGITQKEMVNDPKKWMQALKVTGQGTGDVRFADPRRAGNDSFITFL